MSRILRLRNVSDEEAIQIRKLASSKTQPANLVQRAKIIQLLLDNPKMYVKDAAVLVGFKSDQQATTWVKRFNKHGLDGLKDKQRSGRPTIHTQDTRSSLINLALQKPNSLGYPFALWTLERLQTAFKERKEIHLSDSTIWEWLADEGLVWKRQQSWFHEPEKHDPEFVEKRGQ
jgi:transposase